MFFAVECWGVGFKASQQNKTQFVVQLKLDSLEAVAEKKVVDKIGAILDKPNHLQDDEGC